MDARAGFATGAGSSPDRSRPICSARSTRSSTAGRCAGPRPRPSAAMPLRRAQLAKPEPHLTGVGRRALREVVRLEQAAQHRPVLVALRLLGLDQVGQRHHLASSAVRQLEGVASGPEPRERVHSPHPGHDVDAHARSVRVLAAKVNGVPPPEVASIERGHRDDLGAEVGEGFSQAREVCRASEDGEIGVAAELGGAVQDAGLSSHQQRAHPPRFDRRKDCAYRVRDQAILRGRGTSSTACRSPGSAAAARGRTSLPILGLPHPRRAAW